jgi:hypothetical protein
MKNAEAQSQYYDEVAKLVLDVDMRFVRARLPNLSMQEAKDTVERVLDGATIEGIVPEDLIRIPHPEYFRRRGVPAFRMVGTEGQTFEALDEYLGHLAKTLPESYLASSDFREFAEALRKIDSGELTADDAAKQMPTLRRVAGSCPCSKSVRWVVEEAGVRERVVTA